MARISNARTLAVLSASAAVLLCTPGLSRPALAGTCANVSIEARGEPARFAFMAKTKARANWRRKVRATPGLGPKYATWANAQNTNERCLSGPANTLCIFSGTPCLP